MFKYKRKNNKFIWSDKRMKVVFSNPSIQSHNTYIKVSEIEDIMYYYYRVRVYVKMFDLKKWRKISDIRTHDFPMLPELQYFMTEAIVDDCASGEHYTLCDGNEYYKKVWNTDGFGCDDYYEITKIVSNNKVEAQYYFYAGVSIDGNGGKVNIGARSDYINTKDMEALKQCIDSFIEYSMQKHNDETIKYIEENRKNKKVKNKKLYVYKPTNTTYKKIDSIFVVGDTVLSLDIYKDNFAVEEIRHAKITTISPTEVCFDNNISVKPEDIIEIFLEVNDAKLKYDEFEIATDFYNILSSEEMEEFDILPDEYLIDKYGEAIVDRTNMMRDEHGFDIDRSKNYPESIKHVLKAVISILKSKL